MFYLGVDPGMNGAIAILEDEDIVQIFDMPTTEVKVGKSIKKRVNPQELVLELALFKNQHIKGIIEQVNAMPNQGVTSMFSFGRSLGVIEGVLAGCMIPYTHVTPAVWKKAIGVNSSKDGAREMAMRIWPTKTELFKRKKDDGRAEAALLALYLYQVRK
jgi:crossover junction endodeoxyribonuclease RuvC